MKIVTQRVSRAEVRVEGKSVGKINRGMLIFIGVSKGDTFLDAEYLAKKVMQLRMFEDQEGKMNLSSVDNDSEILVVSQFTLVGDCRKGRRPSFIKAATPDLANSAFCDFRNISKSVISASSN